MNKINSIFMQMCHEGCQSAKENLLPVSDAQDKQLQEMNNGPGRGNLPGWPSPRSFSLWWSCVLEPNSSVP